MENYNNDVNFEILKDPDPLDVVKRLTLERENKLIAENLFEMMLPLPYTSSETLEQDVSMLMLQKIVFPFM